MRVRLMTSMFASALTSLTIVSSLLAAPESGPGAAYVLTNSVSGNAVVAFDRAADGSLTALGSFATGGAGTGSGLGSQGAVIVSDDGRLLFAVNAGSSTISSFRIEPEGLSLVDTVPSGGAMPTSLTYRHGLLYVLNAGAPNSLAGFHVNAKGKMAPIAGSSRPLSAAQTAPAQVGFSDDGDTILVTERATNRVDTFAVGDDGLLDGPYVHPSAGPTPFGFAVNRHDTVLVSEAGAGGGASTYQADGAALVPASSMIMTGQRAACWAVITTNGRFGYVSNAGTGNISGFAIEADGTASLLDSGGVTAVTGGNPTDMAVSKEGGYLFVRVGAFNQVMTFRVASDVSLSAVSAVSVPAGAVGMAAF